MNMRLSAIVGLMTAGLLAIGTQQLHSRQNGSSIQVTLHYTGSGTVDEHHKIYVALWDNPGFTQGNGTPTAVESTASKTGSVTFSNVTANPAYVSAAYDPTGKWDAHAAPPSGTSLGMYSEKENPSKPGPIPTGGGKSATATISFDDSVKVP